MEETYYSRPNYGQPNDSLQDQAMQTHVAQYDTASDLYTDRAQSTGPESMFGTVTPSAEPEPVQPEPVQPEPVRPEPVQSEPVQPEFVQQEPMQPVTPNPYSAGNPTQMYASAVEIPRRTNTKDTKQSGFGRKLIACISLGLFFGIFAGVGFLAVQKTAEFLPDDNAAAVYESGNRLDQPMGKSEADTNYGGSAKESDEVTSHVVYSTEETNITEIVKDVMPAMVSIINNYTATTSFWGQTYTEELSASGSGIIVARTDKELLIVTNNHVVEDATKLKVTLIDQTEVEAKIKGVDAEMDLAVIAIDLEDLTGDTLNAIEVASLGDSDALQLGEQVIAIGNALGYGQSVTVGYVSALDREIELEDGSYHSFIQTDAAINPGNSGGALLNAAGQVIGINSNKIGGSSIEGMGYAIPITTASPIIRELMERQTRTKVPKSEIGYMGISYQDVTPQVSQMYGIPEGVYVVTVEEDSAADYAGLKKGDIIVAFDGNKIRSFEDLQGTLQYYAAGDEAKLTIKRPFNGDYDERELKITLGKRPR